MRRRDFVKVIGSVVATWRCCSAGATENIATTCGVLRVGFPRRQQGGEYFREGLRDAGYTEGRDVIIEWRSADGDYSRVPGLIEDLIQKGAEVIVQDSTVGTGSRQTSNFDNPYRHGPSS